MKKNGPAPITVVIEAPQISTSRGMKTKDSVVELPFQEAQNLIKQTHAKKADKQDEKRLETSRKEAAKQQAEARIADIDAQLDQMGARANDLLEEKALLEEEHDLLELAPKPDKKSSKKAN